MATSINAFEPAIEPLAGNDTRFIINSNRLASQAFIGSKDFVSKLRQDYGIKEIKSKGVAAEEAKTLEASPSFFKA